MINVVVEDAEFMPTGKSGLLLGMLDNHQHLTPARMVGGLRQSGGEQTPNQEIQPDASQATD